MRIHFLQHVPFEGIAYIGQWVHQRNFSLTRTALYADEPLPNPADFDGLVVLGGPMGVADTAIYPWMSKEKRFLEHVVALQKPVIGICLGAQFIADVLGARVYRNKHKEIGWYEVTRVGDLADTTGIIPMPERYYAFHWHGDTFDIPSGGIHLASSMVCRNQAFFFPPSVLALQFHLEINQHSIHALLEHCRNELVAGPWIQSAADILGQMDLIPQSNNHMDAILDWFAGHASNGIWHKHSPAPH